MTVHESPSPAVARKPLRSYKLLAFDIYGTLVDEEGGVKPHIFGLQDYLPASHPLRKDGGELYRLWYRIEFEVKAEHPTMPYHEVLANTLKVLARRDLQLSTDVLSEADLKSRATTFGNSVQAWTAFPDSVSALKELHALGVKLAPLTNMTNTAFANTNRGPLESFPFDAVFTAEDIGSYKPDLRNFEYLFSKAQSLFGVSKDEILMVAHGLASDHEPAKHLGLQSFWIKRPGSDAGTETEADEGTEQGRWAFGWSADTLGDLAAAIKDSKQQ